MLLTILVVLLILALVGPNLGIGPAVYGGPYGTYYGGGIGLVLIIVVVLSLAGRI